MDTLVATVPYGAMAQPLRSGMTFSDRKLVVRDAMRGEYSRRRSPRFTKQKTSSPKSVDVLFNQCHQPAPVMYIKCCPVASRVPRYAHRYISRAQSSDCPWCDNQGESDRVCGSMTTISTNIKFDISQNALMWRLLHTLISFLHCWGDEFIEVDDKGANWLPGRTSTLQVSAHLARVPRTSWPLR